MFKRRSKEKHDETVQPGIDQEEFRPMTLEQAKRLMYIAANFNEVVQSLPEDHPTRLKIEQDQEDLRRSREAGHDLANKMAKTIIN
jgi:hypothetical protein